MKIAFRTDASLEIGTGHVMRCLTLARALRGAGAVCHFVTRAHPGHMGARIAAEGFDVTLLPAPHGPVPKGPPVHARWAGVDWVRIMSVAFALMRHREAVCGPCERSDREWRRRRSARR